MATLNDDTLQGQCRSATGARLLWRAIPHDAAAEMRVLTYASRLRRRGNTMEFRGQYT